MRFRSNGLNLQEGLTVALLGCFHGSIIPGGVNSRYSPGCTHLGGENWLKGDSIYQCTLNQSRGTATGTGGGLLHKGDKVPVSLGIVRAGALVVLEGVAGATSRVQFIQGP